MKRRYICTLCDYIYDPEVEDSNLGITPGTTFKDLPGDGEYPDCSVRK